MKLHFTHIYSSSNGSKCINIIVKHESKKRVAHETQIQRIYDIWTIHIINKLKVQTPVQSLKTIRNSSTHRVTIHKTKRVQEISNASTESKYPESPVCSYNRPFECRLLTYMESSEINKEKLELSSGYYLWRPAPAIRQTHAHTFLFFYSFLCSIAHS